MVAMKAEDCLPPGWKVDVRVRKSGKKDRYYIDPDSGYVFRSLKDIDRYLSSGELGRHVTKTKPKYEGCSEVKFDAYKSLGEPTGRKILVYDKSRKSRLVDLRKKLSSDTTRKEVVAGDESREEVTKAIDQKLKKVGGTKTETRKEGPRTRSETRKQGTRGKNGTKEEVSGANETKKEDIRCTSESKMEVEGGGNETKECARGQSETKVVTGVGNDTTKEGKIGKNETTMEITGERNETDFEDSLLKSYIKEAAGSRNKKKNGGFIGKSEAKELTEDRNESIIKGSTSESEARNKVSGTKTETNKEGIIEKSDEKNDGTMHKKQTKKKVENKTKKELIRARTETKKELTPSRQKKRKKLSEDRDLKIALSTWKEETTPLFVHDLDECRADPTLNHLDISGIIDAVQKAEGMSDAQYLSAPAIGQLLVRQVSETQNQPTTANLPCIYNPNFPPPQGRNLLPVDQVPVGAPQLNVFDSKSGDWNAAETCSATKVRVGNELVKNGLGSPLPSEDVGDVWLDPCIDFAIKTLTGTDPAIEDYFQRQQQPHPAKPERVSYYFQQQQQSPAKSERVGYYFQQLQPSSSNLGMVSYCCKANEDPRPICNVDGLRFEDLAIDDKGKTNVSKSIPRLRC